MSAQQNFYDPCKNINKANNSWHNPKIKKGNKEELQDNRYYQDLPASNYTRTNSRIPGTFINSAYKGGAHVSGLHGYYNNYSPQNHKGRMKPDREGGMDNF